MYTTPVNPADLGVVAAAAALAALRAVLARAHRGVPRAHPRARRRAQPRRRPGSINAWVRVYEEDALAAAARADERLAAGTRPPLCGVPIGLKDLYAVAGKPLTASSRLLDEVPERDCDAWARLGAEGMVLLGHLHTHEFAVGGTTDQVGNPWALELGGRLERRLRRGARGAHGAGRDRHGHGRLAAHPLGDVRDVDDQADARPSCRCGGSSRWRRPSTTPGRWRASSRDCEPLLAAMAGRTPPASAGRCGRVAVSPRDRRPRPRRRRRFERCARGAPAPALVDAPPLPRRSTSATVPRLVLHRDARYHRRFDDGARATGRRARVPRARRARALSAEDYVAAQPAPHEHSRRLGDWLAEHRIDAIVEPTCRSSPTPRPRLRRGVHRRRGDLADALLGLDGLPGRRASVRHRRAQRPAGERLADRPARRDWDLLATGAALQAELGTVSP